MNSASQFDNSHVRQLQASQPGLYAHCRRVAALAFEIAGRLRLPPGAQQTANQAAFLHHYPIHLFEPETLERLMTDLAGPEWRGLVDSDDLAEPLSQPVKAVLEALNGSETADERSSVLAGIIEVANFVDEQFEALPLFHQTVEQILDELRSMAQEGMFQPQVVMALTNLPRGRKEDLMEIVCRLPVFPTVALKTLALTSDEEISVLQLENLASSDQVLAGNLLKVSNSSLYSPVKCISSIRQAISFMGLDATRRVLMAAVLQPLYGSANLKALWDHSLQMAQLAERLANLSHRIDPKVAYLAGLIHDIGRLAIQKVSGEVAAAYARFLERGCPPVFAELLLFRFDHAAAGAEILRLWNFPEDLIQAVCHHHEPERSDSDLAALLYLAEFWSGSEEDLPSVARLKKVLERLEVSIEMLQSAEHSPGLLDPLITSNAKPSRTTLEQLSTSHR